MHEKGLQRQIGVGTLVNSQQRSALAVPVINRGSTGRFVPPSVYIGFPLFVLAKRRPGQFLQCAGGSERLLASKATGMSAPCSAQRCPAPPSALRRADPTRPLLCPSIGLDRCSCLRRDVQNSFLQCAGGPQGRLASKTTEMSAPCSA